jgi:biofilm PGA synthesis N-glycosyltransferase PgaC
VSQRLLVVSPVRNEAAHIERVARAVAAQTRPPDLWLVIDDGSSDNTASILAGLERELDFMSVHAMPRTSREDAVKDRLAAAAAPRAFNFGLDRAPWRTFTHIAKLDGDTELPPRYFELLLEQFASNPRLGLAGGVRVEHVGGRQHLERVPTRYHVPGALKCYTLECFEAIGGMQERLAWDTIDEVYARMRGFQTRALPELIAIHCRPWGSADGLLRGHVRHGRCAHIVHYPPGWAALRALKTAGLRPWGISGLAYLAGYFGAAARSSPRVADPEFRRFFRRELRRRERERLVRPLLSRRGPRPLAEREG